jgi:hypothetical protein
MTGPLAGTFAKPSIRTDDVCVRSPHHAIAAGPNIPHGG